METLKRAEFLRDRFTTKVFGVFRNGHTEYLFRYYHDELWFSPEEFVGLTVEEARNVFHKKDVAYLRK